MSEVWSVWFLIGAALVFFMQCGFAMVETGFTRAKNAGNIIMKNLMDFCIGTPMFMLLGFGLMMSENYLFGFIGKPDMQLFTNFADLEVVKHAFSGIRVAVCVLIISALARLWKKSVVDIWAFIIFAVIFILSAFDDLLHIPFDISPVPLVIGAAVAGIIIKAVKENKKAKDGDRK